MKVVSPSGVWDSADSPGLDPQVGDLLSSKAWRNLGFIYTTDGSTFDAFFTNIGQTGDAEH